jgi:hypothetical protein
MGRLAVSAPGRGADVSAHACIELDAYELVNSIGLTETGTTTEAYNCIRGELY